MKDIKVKPLTTNQLIISIDRLTRFKNTKDKYLRVFCDIITSNLISPQYKKSQLLEMDPKEITNLAQHIINYSLEALGYKNDNDFSLNEKLLKYEQNTFLLDSKTLTMLRNEINYKAFLNLIDNNSAKNLRWLKALNSNKQIENERFEKSLQFPVEKVVIAEGATEEILLPEFAKHCDYDFDKHGIYIISAGGKNQVVKLYYQLAQTLKLPIFVLLDKDAKENLEEIQPKLRKSDKIHLLKCGEFEDLLPAELVKKTLEYELSNISILEQEMFCSDEPRTKMLENIYKNRGMHEFKKVEFAQSIKKNITSEKDISVEILEIINEIKVKPCLK